jgi:hypothetical protein
MAREVDPKRTRKALRLVRKLAEAQPAEDYSGWEKEFLDEVGGRLDKFGSAFNDGAKGRLDEPLSNLQAVKLKEIAAKAAGKSRKPMGWKKKQKPPPPPPEE